MVRAPYPARIAAGLLVVAIEETRKLPTLLVTLPMTAISSALQTGMRVQQGIAGLAIKGDEALESIFDRPSEAPEWARFDDDTDTDTADTSESAPATPEAPPPADPAPEPPAPGDTAPQISAAPRIDAGRFALYTSAPADLIAGQPADDDPADDARSPQRPEIVDHIDYDALTLAQLRAKLRSVGTDDLAAIIDYEKATRNRVPFLTMLENRIDAQHKRKPAT
ncbi:MAG: lipid droplet-associated protein [Gordonia sp. (in: high G+C Gram-positive bacteria)]